MHRGDSSARFSRNQKACRRRAENSLQHVHGEAREIQEAQIGNVWEFGKDSSWNDVTVKENELSSSDTIGVIMGMLK